MASPQQIVRCVKSDIGDLVAGAEYCERIARSAALNPWSDPADAHNYREAAKVLRAEAETTIADGFGSEWDSTCEHCGQPTMQVVRPGKAQCANGCK